MVKTQETVEKVQHAENTYKPFQGFNLTIKIQLTL